MRTALGKFGKSRLEQKRLLTPGRSRAGKVDPTFSAVQHVAQSLISKGSSLIMSLMKDLVGRLQKLEQDILLLVARPHPSGSIGCSR